MSTQFQKSPKTGRQSLFFRDIASPVCQKGKFSTPGQAAAVSALWRDNFGGADPPPPPIYTLEDRVDFSPEAGVGDYPTSPDFKSEMRTPSRDSMTPLKGKLSFGASTDVTPPQGLSASHSPGSSSWWSHGKGIANGEEQRKGSPVDGIVQHPETSTGLLMLPPPREVARPEVQRNSLPSGSLDEEEWVTVYGFGPGDTNLVLREFEKCGVILKHIPGPRDANWMHILYQSRFDAQKALAKNGLQINGLLIVGVKPLDPTLRHSLSNKFSSQGFMVLPPPSSDRSSVTSHLKASPRPYYPQPEDSSRSSVGAIASPSKSVLSRIADLMFGI
ncbi:Nuclear pore complex protein [Nymphaea thermarum]|nr:Nuclear pore complex protein [Nymphaea thermarum]